MDITRLIEVYGPIATLLFLAGWTGIQVIDRMTKAKAGRAGAEDRIDELSTGMADRALTQNYALQQKLFDELERRDKDQAAQREVLKIFADELKSASSSVLLAVKRLENVLVHIGDLDERSGTYFKSILSEITELKTHIKSEKDQS